MTQPYDDGSGKALKKGFSKRFHSKLAVDAATLSAAHVLGLVVPFLTVPYLARVLRPEGFGLLLFSQSFGLWLVLVIEFGFDLSGTRIVSRIRENPTRLEEVVLGVQSAKILALLLTIPFAVAAFIAVPLFRDNPAYLIWGFLFAGARGLSPNWYFFWSRTDDCSRIYGSWREGHCCYWCISSSEDSGRWLASVGSAGLGGEFGCGIYD
ncbi:MAG: hypothetical protein Ct9H300mP15_30460 [Gemmatimonadota bacterium]|nr:MAG: hypothetical protein Ct9H300mP15_30460 [Gemmatimonadota bacterium]